MSQFKWDQRFLELAEFVAGWSKDPSTKCGAVIVRPDRTIASVGYNGFPRKMPDRPEWYADRAQKYPRIVHCEINARDAMHERPEGCTLYTYPFLTCDRCAVQMIQAGIIRVVAPLCPVDQASRWEETLKKARAYYDECGVEHAELPYASTFSRLRDAA